MKSLAVYALMLGLLAMFAFSEPGAESGRAESLAVNFALFRNAAWTYAHENPDFTGALPMDGLSLPHGWTAARPWEARTENGICYVYGPASAEEIADARRVFRNSQAVGYAVAGRLDPGSLPLPGFIPAGWLVSLMEVK